jgi:cobalt/nickel transport protein
MKLKWWHIALLVALLVAFLSPLASSSPDGLEKVAEDKGFIDEAAESPYELMADYLFPGVENEAVATILSGIIGTLAIFGLAYGAARLLRRRQETKIR